MELWPLIPDTALNAWWSDLLVENTPDQKGGADARILGQAIFKQREEALRTFLALEGIPADDWKFLKSRHGYTRKKVYLALVEYPAFRSVHGRGDPIKESQFMRKFWAEQDIAALE
jgi:hypothetical protein